VLEVVAGPMFSGKTDELLRRAAGGVLVKPHVDDRHDFPEIVAHSGARAAARVVAASAELPDVPLLGVDEGQFFDDGLVEAVARLSAGGARVIVAALDRDFRGEPFALTEALRGRADRYDLLSGVCSRCGDPATLTQRFRDGVPVPLGDDVVRIGGRELYAPRCARCWTEERAAVRVSP
jgi:thymidine kinase